MHEIQDKRRPGHRRLGGLQLIRNAAGDVLLEQPAYRPRNWWQLPGGGAAPTEWLHDAARREVREELDLRRSPGDLLIVDHVSPSLSGAVEGLNFVFDGGQVTELDIGRIRLSPEIREYRFVPIEELTDICPLAQNLRITEALLALRHPTARGYLINGFRPDNCRTEVHP